MKVDVTLKEFRNKDLVSIKNILVFDEKKLKERLRNFYMFENKLTNLSYEELKEWISLFKMNDETIIHIKIETDRFEMSKGKISNKSKLIITLYHIFIILSSRVSLNNDKEDRGRIVREALDDEDAKKVIHATVNHQINKEQKLSRKNMLVLKKG